MPRLKNLIERAYREGEKKWGISVWGVDQAGPFQTMPYPGASWEMQGKPARQPHQHLRNGTAKLMSLFHPATGEVRVKGVRSCTNAVFHPWLKEHLRAILKTLPPPKEVLNPKENRARWKSWQEGLTVKVTLPEELPPLRTLWWFGTISRGTRVRSCSCGCSPEGSWCSTRLWELRG